jgi:hypothetical protein
MVLQNPQPYVDQHRGVSFTYVNTGAAIGYKGTVVRTTVG